MGRFNTRWIGDLARQFLSSGLSQAMRAAQTFLEEALRDVCADALRSLQRLASLYVLLFALACVSLYFLGAALAEGLGVLGVPAWVSHLIGASLGGAAAGVVVLRMQPVQTDRSPQDSQDQEGSSARSSLLTLKIVHVHPRPRTDSKKSRSRVRRRRRAVVEVRPAEEGWLVTRGGEPQTKEVFATKREAVKAARVAARDDAAEVVISRTRGSKKDPVQGVA